MVFKNAFCTKTRTRNRMAYHAISFPLFADHSKMTSVPSMFTRFFPADSALGATASVSIRRLGTHFFVGLSISLYSHVL